MTWPSGLLARQTEREALDRLLRGGGVGESRVRVLRGDAGVGKTALLRHLASIADAIARLASEGATHREIGARLFISPRPVAEMTGARPRALRRRRRAMPPPTPPPRARAATAVAGFRARGGRRR